MKMITVPDDMELDLGYRTLVVRAGQRAYPDEVANHHLMVPFWDPEPEADTPAPTSARTAPPADATA